jgi:hypothetical protein
MSHNTIREDKTCLNCNHVVAEKFCPNCGQENIDTRKTFYQLFVHFFEDLTHYENSFWKTIRNLILKPASLTIEYLSGKRMSYLAPIRLYIFISFATFLIISILPDKEKNFNIKNNPEKITVEELKDTIYNEQQRIIDLEKEGVLSKSQSDSLQNLIKEAKLKRINDLSTITFGKKYKSVEQLDSIQKYGKPDDKLGSIEYWIIKKSLETVKGKTSKELKKKFFESFIKNIPKALFIYMPLFAFVLWLFQNKKRWYYFDHGIFTLHYFSFLLLATLIIELYSFLFGLLGDSIFITSIVGVLDFIIICYMLYYFFPAHHRFYAQSRAITILKGIIIFFINMVILGVILTGIAVYSFINIH